MLTNRRRESAIAPFNKREMMEKLVQRSRINAKNSALGCLVVTVASATVTSHIFIQEAVTFDNTRRLGLQSLHYKLF